MPRIRNLSHVNAEPDYVKIISAHNMCCYILMDSFIGKRFQSKLSCFNINISLLDSKQLQKIQIIAEDNRILPFLCIALSCDTEFHCCFKIVLMTSVSFTSAT